MTKTKEGTIEISTDGEIGYLTIKNPENRNAMNLSMYKQFPDSVTKLLNANIRVIIVRGYGEEAFGAGSDISEFNELRSSGNAHIYDHAEVKAHTALTDVPVPTLAMIHGACRGGGLAIALACDLRFASDDASFAAPPAKLGIAFPDSAVELLTVTVGDSHARHLLLTASTINSNEAYRIGLIHRINKKLELGEVVNSTASQISKLAPLSLAAAKTSLAQLKGQATAEQVQKAIDNCYRSNDYQEGISAFIAKRKPNFDGT
ncbi:MAG: enoyl-CoA hydratase [Acidimicrobiaceae bacterium]|nr:enoyl-CoA hydratase [Acidimicrobiaceae bacterium]